MSKISASKLIALAKQYSQETIISDGSILKCGTCNVPIKIDENHQKQQIERHIKSQCHCTTLSKAKPSHDFIADAFKKCESASEKLKEFEFDLTSSLVESGIPIEKLNSKAFREFLEKYTKMRVPDESTVRKNYVQ